MSDVNWRCPECETINTANTCIICGFDLKDLMPEPPVIKVDKQIDWNKFDSAVNSYEMYVSKRVSFEERKMAVSKEKTFKLPSIIATLCGATGIIIACPLLMWLLASL